MKADITKISECRLKLNVKAEASEIRDDYEKVIKDYINNSKINGYRHGKAPRLVVEREYRQQIDQSLHQTLVTNVVERIVKQEALAVVDAVGVENVLLSSETGISFDFICEVEPEFKLPKYIGLSLPVPKEIMTEADVDSRLASLREQYASIEDCPADYTVELGDYAAIEFSATSDGKPLKELTEKSSMYAEGTGFWLQAVEQGLIPGVAPKLVGMKIGDEREIDMEFPEDFSVEELRGVKATYKIKVQALRRAVMPTDEALLAAFKIESMDKLREAVRTKMEQQSERVATEKRARLASEQLLSKVAFDLPDSQLTRLIEKSLQSRLYNRVRSGATSEELAKERDAMLSEVKEQCTNTLRLRYILLRIAKAESIKASPEEVDQRVRELARSYGKTVKDVAITVMQSGQSGDFVNDITIDKTLKFIVDSAKE